LIKDGKFAGGSRSGETRRIGATGVAVTQLGFGGTAIGGMFGEVTPDAAEDALIAGHGGGVRYFDTAPFYGLGEAERRLGRTVRAGRLPDVTLSTKVGRTLRWLPGAGERDARVLPWFDYSGDGILRSLEDTIQRTGIDCFDIVYLHDLSTRWHGASLTQRMREAAEGGLPVLQDLKRQGVIKAIGIGTNDPPTCRAFLDDVDLDVVMLAGCYTLINQTGLPDLLPTCQERGISVILAAPFNSGILATGATDDAKYFYAAAPEAMLERTRRIEAIGACHDVELPAAALQFALGHPAIVSVVAGISSAGEARANIALMDAPIPAAFWEELAQDGLIDAAAPRPGAP